MGDDAVLNGRRRGVALGDDGLLQFFFNLEIYELVFGLEVFGFFGRDDGFIDEAGVIDAFAATPIAAASLGRSLAWSCSLWREA